MRALSLLTSISTIAALLNRILDTNAGKATLAKKKFTLVTMLQWSCVCVSMITSVCACLLCAELGFSVSALRIISPRGWRNSCDAHLSLSHSLWWRMGWKKAKALHINIRPSGHTHTDAHAQCWQHVKCQFTVPWLFGNHTPTWRGIILVRVSNHYAKSLGPAVSFCCSVRYT